MADREKVIECLQKAKMVIETWVPMFEQYNTPAGIDDALELLKEQEAKERKWLQAIADNQIANAPKDSPMSLDEQLESEYKSGIYDGLQMAFEILMEGR